MNETSCKRDICMGCYPYIDRCLYCLPSTFSWQAGILPARKMIAQMIMLIIYKGANVQLLSCYVAT